MSEQNKVVQKFTSEQLEYDYVNEIHKSHLSPKLISVTALNPVARALSSSRAQMFNSHLGQCLVPSGANSPTVQSGFENEVGEYTFKITMPFNGIVLAVFERYSKKSLSQNSIPESPEKIVIIRDPENNLIEALVLPKYCSHHTYFGFRYKDGPGMAMLRPGVAIGKGVVFLNSPNVSADGDYCYAVEVNVAMGTHPAGSDDSFLFRRGALNKFSYNSYYRIIVEHGRDRFPLNLYGDIDNYKPHPEIGETIRDDGLLMATRSYDPIQLSPIMMNKKACMEVDYNFDHTVYVKGPGGKVIDIIVHHDPAAISRSNYVETQDDKYHNSRLEFLKNILEFDKTINKDYGGNIKRGAKYGSLLVEALSVTNTRRADKSSRLGHKVNKIYRQEKIDRYFIEFVIEYHNVPNIGSKFTGRDGDKGVCCQIGEDEHMFVDEDGNMADVICDPSGTANRMNPSRSYAHYWAAAARDARKELCRRLNIEPGTKIKNSVGLLNKLSREELKFHLEYVLKLQSMVYPKIWEWYERGDIGYDPVDYLSTVIQEKITILSPNENDKEIIKTVQDIENSEYRPVYGPVSYVGNSGRKVVTKKPIRVAPMYIMVLEKDGSDWNSCAIAKRNHSGVPSQIRKDMKHLKPVRDNAARLFGESEVRVIASYCGGEVITELIDRSNSYASTMSVCDSILTSNQPTNIYRAVDREKVPLGLSSPLEFIRSTIMCAGFRFKYVPDSNDRFESLD